MPVTLPDFPWDSLAPSKATAEAHPDGIVDLSVGTPVDPTPPIVRQALTEAADAPGYPLTWGTEQLRASVASWFARRRGVPDLDPDGVLPTIGSKELVAWLPSLLGLGPGDIVGVPAIAYPTYAVGARLAAATPLVVDGLAALGPMTISTTPKLLWLNSPSNPTGAVLPSAHLAKVVAWARSHGVVVASDECYAELDWRPAEDGDGTAYPGALHGSTPSILDPEICAGTHEGLLAVYSLSKQSSMAGYRAGFVAGDPALVRALLEVRKHAGMIVPWPVQRAMVAALGDDGHVAEQKERYRARRALLLPALERAGLRIEHSQAGLYLWATRDWGRGGAGRGHSEAGRGHSEAGRGHSEAGEDCWTTVGKLAERGILVAPGAFYGAGGQHHVRVALTATDERIEAAAQRL